MERLLSSPASALVFGKTCVHKPQWWGFLGCPDSPGLAINPAVLLSAGPEPGICLFPRDRGVPTQVIAEPWGWMGFLSLFQQQMAFALDQSSVGYRHVYLYPCGSQQLPWTYRGSRVLRAFCRIYCLQLGMSILWRAFLSGLLPWQNLPCEHLAEDCRNGL